MANKCYILGRIFVAMLGAVIGAITGVFAVIVKSLKEKQKSVSLE